MPEPNVHLYVSPEVLTDIQDDAQQQGITVNNWLDDALRQKLGQPTAANIATLIDAIPDLLPDVLNGDGEQHTNECETSAA